MTHSEAEARSHPPRVSAKRRQILAGARSLFSEAGFERASVDQVAARAGVSKATVYHHFHDKKTLFVTCFSEEADALRESVRCKLLRAEPSGDVAVALQAVGEHLLRLVLAPEIIALYRNTAAEVERFPELGRLLFERGPAAMKTAMTEYLRRWQSVGALRLDDPAAAAVEFIMLCRGELACRSSFGVLPEAIEPAIIATVARGVGVFLAAYRA